MTRTLSVTIGRPCAKVYDFVADPENLPKWAKAFCLSIQRVGDGWTALTPAGPMGLRFCARNTLGVLDHWVAPEPGFEVYVPMRVVPHGECSEVLFTLFKLPEMSDAKFAEDAAMVEKDLASLKKVLEK
ncbi:MAG: SRPBCC family protein [Planctomycetes bacterium]|nr:SRPBCC family protein [Planctomycetota bacterium]